MFRLTPHPTAADAQRYREQLEVGLIEASAGVRKLWIDTNLCAIQAAARDGESSPRELLDALITLIKEMRHG